MRIADRVRLLAYHAVRLGVPGALGVAMLLVAAGLVAVETSSRNTTLSGLQRQLGTAAEELRRQDEGQGGGAAGDSPDEVLALFYRDFPGEEAIPAWLEKIYGLAGKVGLALESGEYALVRAKSGHLNQYRISFPVKGSYPDIRRFISEVLATTPAIALESVALKRESVGQEAVDSRVVFLLYVEAAR